MANPVLKTDRSKNFLISTANVAFYHNGMLAFTGTTSLNTSISVEMSDQEITGGKSSQLLYSYKYGRRVNPTVEFAEWNLAYIAANVGSPIFEGFRDVFSVAECVTITNGVGILAKEPVSDVYVEVEAGKPAIKIALEDVVNKTFTLTDYSELNGKVYATYKYNTITKTVTINSDTTPLIGELVLTADRFNNKTGKNGEIQIDIPSFQLSGSFEISMEAEGNTSTSIEGSALAVEGDSCADGSVYAYVNEIDLEEKAISVSEIAVIPAVINAKVGDVIDVNIIGLRTGVYSNVEIRAKDCTAVSDNEAVTVASTFDGKITAASEGEALVTVTYNDTVTDIVKVTVVPAV